MNAWPVKSDGPERVVAAQHVTRQAPQLPAAAAVGAACGAVPVVRPPGSAWTFGTTCGATTTVETEGAGCGRAAAAAGTATSAERSSAMRTLSTRGASFRIGPPPPPWHEAADAS